MTSSAPWTSSFFVTGGTLALDAASYVERQSDEELYRWLHRGEFCYVLTARQMGKSSLMVRTASRLRDEGIGTLILDLTTLGQGVSPEQWYRGMLAIAGEQLELECELDEFWAGHRDLGPLQRWFAALRHVVLPRYPHGLVVFVDEIDAVRGLSFRPDDFFAAIRASANGYVNGHAGTPANRSDNEARLTFCLLGVATPADLIRDTRNTPFNIGHRIVLQDFTAAEAAVLAQGLRAPEGGPRRDADRLLERVLYWTAGQPYLSQRLCKAVADNPKVTTPADVDRRCAELFFAPGALRRETHLLFAQELLLRSAEDVGGLLGLYARIRAGLPVPDDETDPFVSLLRLSGVVRIQGKRLRLRNRIYARVFNRRWVREHLPEAEHRRQRAAFWRGALIVGAAGTAVGLLLASITAAALRSEASARRNAVKAQQLAGFLQRTDKERTELLASLRQANAALRERTNEVERKAKALIRSEAREHTQRLAAENSGRQAAAATARAEAATLQEEAAKVQAVAAARLAERRGADTRRGVARLHAETGDSLVRDSRFLEALPWFISAARLEGEDATKGRTLTLIRSLLAESPRMLRLWAPPKRISGALYSPDGKWLAMTRTEGGLELQPAAGGATRLLRADGPGVRSMSFSPDSKRLVVSALDDTVQIWDVAAGTPTVQLSNEGRHTLSGVVVFIDHGRRLVTLEDKSGRMRLWDSQTGRPLRDVGAPPIDGANLMAIGDSPYLLAIAFRQIQVVDLRNGAVISRGPGVSGSFAANRDGSLLAVADGIDVNIWQMPKLTFKGHFTTNRLTRTLSFQPDGRLRTVGIDGTVRDWNPLTYRPMSEPVRLPGPVVVTAMVTPAGGASCGREVLTIDPSGVARTWDLASRVERATFLRPPATSGPAAFNAAGTLAAMPGEDGWVRVVETATGRPAHAPLRAGNPLTCAAFSPDGTWLAVAGYGAPPRLWNWRTGAAGPVLEPPTGLARRHGIVTLAFSPDGRRLLAVRTDHQAQLYDLRSGRALPPVPSQGMQETPAPFSSDGRRLLLRSEAIPDFNLWLIKENHLMREAELDYSGSWTEFSADGRLIVTANQGNTIGLWRVAEAKPLRGNLPRGERIAFATFSPDGSKIATIDTSTGAASLWDRQTFRPLLQPLGGRGGIGRAAFSPDSRRLAVAAENGDLEVWDIMRGRLVVAPYKARLDVGVALGMEKIHELRFSADGSCVLAAFENGSAVSLPLECGPALPKLADLTDSQLGGAPGSTVAPAPLDPERVVRAWERCCNAQERSPASTQAADMRWHREQWRDCERIGLWNAAASHLSRLIEAEPTSWQLHERRGQLLAQGQRWTEASQDFRAALDRRSIYYLEYYWCALTQLAAGDGEGYRDTCARMLDRFAADPRLRQRDLTAWTCALGPARPEDRARAISMLQEMLHQEPDNASWRSTLGALLCRSGRYREALVYLPTGNAKPDTVLDDLFKALAHHGLRHEREAQTSFATAEQTIAATLRLEPPATPSWEDRLEANVIRSEVRAKMGPGGQQVSP